MSKAVAIRPLPRSFEPAPTIGLALGGGGARGLAHIVLLEALEELGIRPSIIAGTSIGAIYGAAFAAGMPAALLRAHTEETLGQRFDFLRQLITARAVPIQRIFNVLPIRGAFLNAEALLDLVLPLRMPKDFSSLQIPLEVVATDFYAQTQLILKEGPLRPAIAASIALPMLFQPVLRDGRVLMDGGLVNPLPFDLIAGKADITIAIDVSGTGRGPGPRGAPSALEAVLGTSQILQRSIIREKLRSDQPDIYIDVNVGRFQVLEFHRFRDVFAAAAPAKTALKRQLARLLGKDVAAAVIPATPAVPLIEQSAEKPRRRLKLPLRRRSKR